VVHRHGRRLDDHGGSDDTDDGGLHLQFSADRVATAGQHLVKPKAVTQIAVSDFFSFDPEVVNQVEIGRVSYTRIYLCYFCFR